MTVAPQIPGWVWIGDSDSHNHSLFLGSLRRPPTPHPLIKVFFMPAEWEGRSLTPGLVPSAPHSLVSGSLNPLTLAPQIRGLFLFTEHLGRPTRQGYPDTWF